MTDNIKINKIFKDTNIMSDISKEDLALLMDSYRKQVELNTQVIVQQQNLMSRIDTMIEIHKETCSNINRVADKIDEHGKTSIEISNKVSEKLNADRKEGLKEHNDIKFKIYVAMSLMGVIILNLIALYLKT